MLSLRPDERPTAEDILKKAIIKNRIQGYLNGNEFDLKNSKSIIEKYENENKDSNEEIRINVFEEIQSGSLKNINAWMKEHVWKKADRQTPKEWILEITNRELTPTDFLDYIEEKYRKIYEI